MSLTEKVARFVVELTLNDVPAHAIDVAKGGIVDALGVAIAGTRTEAARILTRWARETDSGPHAGVIGGGFKTSQHTAARVNGTIGQALDFDPPTPLLPVLLALGESEGSSGREVLEAYVAGFEVQSKLQGGVSTRHYEHGWHSNAVFGTFGATAAAAKLLKLDVWRTRMAFGIAASEAGGVRQNLGTMTKPYHAGAAAAKGVIATSLAQQGLTSAPDSFEGAFGLLHVFATAGEYDERKIGESFGTPWNLVANEIRIKPYPCCRVSHRALDAILALTRAHNIDPEGVESIECEVSAHVTQLMAFPIALDSSQAKFCLPYCLAVAVCDGRAGLVQFSDERVRDAQVQALAARVHVVHPGGQSEWDTGTLLPCLVRVRLRNGAVLEKSVGAPRGDKDNPMSFDDIVDKYRDCTRDLLSEEQIDHTLTLVQRLEKLEDLSELSTMLTFCVKR